MTQSKTGGEARGGERGRMQGKGGDRYAMESVDTAGCREMQLKMCGGIERPNGEK